MPTYDFNKATVNIQHLEEEIVSAGLPAPDYSISNAGETPNNLHITFTDALDAGQQTTLSNTVTSHTVPSENFLQWKYEITTKQGVKTTAIKRYATDNGDGTYSDLVEEILFAYSGPNIISKEHKVYYDDANLHKREKWEYYTNSSDLVEKKTIG
jgi:hypothetical protein